MTTKVPNARSFHSTFPRLAQYERFPSSGGRRPIGGSGQGPNGRPDVVQMLRRRLGGDRAVVVYGVGVSGALVYYVVQ